MALEDTNKKVIREFTRIFKNEHNVNGVDHLFDDLRVHLSHGQVVQKKKRLRALHQNIVHAVIQNIRAHR